MRSPISGRRLQRPGAGAGEQPHLRLEVELADQGIQIGVGRGGMVLRGVSEGSSGAHRAGTRSAWWQAVRVSSTSRSGGRSAAQTSVASGQRGTNGQPVGDGLGGARGADAERLAGGPAGGLLGRPRHGRRRGQRDRVRVPRRLGDRLDRPGLHDLAAVEHHRPLGEEPDDAQVVGDEQERQAALVAQVGEQVEHLRLGGEVQRRHRLVEDDDLRVADQRPGDRDPLALPAGELGRVAVGRVAGQADRLQAGARLRAAPRRRCTPISRSGSTSVWPMVRAGLSEEYGSWKTTRRSATSRLRCLSDIAGDVLPVQPHRAGGRRLQAEDGLADRRLARAGLADEAEGLARGDVEADAVHGRRGRCAPCGRSRSGRRGRGPPGPGPARRAVAAVAPAGAAVMSGTPAVGTRRRRRRQRSRRRRRRRPR